MSNESVFLLSFIILIVFLLALDLGILQKKSEKVSIKQATFMSVFVVSIALSFYFVLTQYGHLLHGIEDQEKLNQVILKHSHNIKQIPGDFAYNLSRYNYNLGLEYLTGYIVEYALSVDNIFVIVLIFSSFKVAPRNYHRVLFWGILGAIIMRFIFIFVGAALIAKFSWIMYVFGGFLVFTGIKMFLEKKDNEEMDTINHPVIRFSKLFFKVHDRFEGNRFFVNVHGVRMVTPLFLVLIIIEFTDLIFAVDSIPAIFSVTKDPYMVFFSNIFAILGLRSMFFILAGIIDKFRFLKIGLATLLTFIGIKMLAHHYLDEFGFTTTHSLIVILSILLISILASLLFPEKKK